MKKFTPNTSLPKGAKHIKPLRKKVGSWTDMVIDAELKWYGIKWYRVQGGFGQCNNREDWIASIPQGTISVSDYHWRGKPFGDIRYRSFRSALEGETKRGLEHLIERENELRTELQAAESATRIIRKILRRLSK